MSSVPHYGIAVCGLKWPSTISSGLVWSFKPFTALFLRLYINFSRGHISKFISSCFLQLILISFIVQKNKRSKADHLWPQANLKHAYRKTSNNVPGIIIFLPFFLRTLLEIWKISFLFYSTSITTSFSSFSSCFLFLVALMMTVYN